MTTFVVRHRRHGRRRPVQLGGRQGPDPDLEPGRPAPVLAREHQPGPDQGRRRQAAPHREPGQDQLRPRRHDGRHPGPGRRDVRVQRSRPQEGRDHRRPVRLRQGHRRRVRGRVHQARRHRRRPRGRDPKTTDYSADPHQVRGPQPRQRLLRRRHGQRWRSCPQADAAGRPRARCRSSAATASRTRTAASRARSSTSPATAAANSYSLGRRDPRHPRRGGLRHQVHRPSTRQDPGAYSASGYACAQVVIEALDTAASKGDVTREAVRAAGVDTTTTFQTVLGPVQFDAVGDTNQKIISLYKVDMTAASGKGDWVFVKQINYGQ